MNIWRRNAVVAVVVLFVCVALYLSWSYNREAVDEMIDDGVFSEIDNNFKAPNLDYVPILEPYSYVEEMPVQQLQSNGYFVEERLNRQVARDSALTIL
ncbi:MAG: hypothetical protein FWG36_10345, partial [Oscillospiraceae bacterium]|nr:hypothetical protein [Oscillospiraceae bacterium]